MSRRLGERFEREHIEAIEGLRTNQGSKQENWTNKSGYAKTWAI